MRKLALALTLALTLVMGTTTLTGCYGSFTATRKVHAWNGKVTNNKFANSAIMWGLLIIPVYELAWLGDVLIFNTIEVTGGQNPMK
jgi:hypothetical protein